MADNKLNDAAELPKNSSVKKQKKNKMPEGYIGRPKPMKTNTFSFHKPTTKNWIEIGVSVVLIGALVYLVMLLINLKPVTDPFIKPYETSEDAPASYVLENNKLKFELDASTTKFSILQKDTGHVWYSNPLDVESDPIALTKEKNNMNSTLLVKYSTENGVDNVYDSWKYSIQRNFFNVEKKGNEVIVNYTISEMEREYKYPLAIYEEDMDVYLEKLSKSDQNVLIKRCYRLVDIDNLKASDNEADLLRKYPGLEDDNLYLIFDPLNKYLKENCEAIFAKIGYTDEEYLVHKELYKEKNEKSEPAFTVSVSYKLEGDSLIVDIPFDKILYRHAYPIVQLSVLPYFAAGGTSDEGFLFVPEGGGSIINFNNGKTKQNSYYADVYGWDYASDRKAVITETRVAYPVFGVSNEDSSFISIIQNGAEYAGITAEISGKLASYNYVRADYKMIHGEQFEVSTRNTSAQYAYEQNLPEGERITQVYRFINSPSYVDMAKDYRDYLFKGEKKVNNQNMPLAVEIVGAVDKVQQIAGFPKTLPYKLTTYSEAADIINQIDNDMNFKNVSFKLSGFINGGVRQQLTKKVKYIKALGGKSSFKSMIKKVENTSAKLYLDSTTDYANRSDWSDGFVYYRDSARFASDEVCRLNEYSALWYGKDEKRPSYYLLKPVLRDMVMDTIISSSSKNKLSGVSFRDVGYHLSADYNDDGVISRATICKTQQEKLSDTKSKGLNVMINSGNDYAVKSADFITNMTLHGNEYAIIDAHVPFYQIALHGYKNFAGSPVNLGSDNQQIILESAESGAALYFVFMKESEKALQESYYTEYYAAGFDSWKDKFNDIYSRYDREIGKVRNSCISGFEYLDDKVTLTTFDNGYQVLVNFGYVDYTSDSGVTVPAREYKVIQEEK